VRGHRSSTVSSKQRFQASSVSMWAT
jgi:hypothetical protein